MAKMKSQSDNTMKEFIFRRKLDFATNFPEIIVELKASRQFRKKGFTEKI